MATTLTPVQQYFLEKAVESRLALWNALLTVNGIMLTGFSLIPVISQGPIRWKWLLVIVVASCLVSLWLLVWNFSEMKTHYEKLGSVVSGESLPDKEQKSRDIKKEKQRHWMAHLRETTVLSLFFLQTVLSCVYLYLAGR